jgi:WD40 repeat protein
MRALRRSAIVAAASVLVTLAGCSGDDGGGEATPTQTAGASSLGPQAEFILFRDAVGSIVARDLSTDESFQYPVDFNTEVIVSVACTDDGERLAILRQPFSVTERELLVSGRDALPAPITLPEAVQGMDWSPDNTRLVYTEFDGFENVHRVSILDVATGATTELTSGEGVAGSPSWSPDGSTIAYGVQDILSTHADIALIAADGGEPRLAPSPGDLLYYDAEWTPDGSAVLIAGQAEGEIQIYEIDPESGDREQLTASSDIYKRGPEYSPDGETIAYTGSIILPTVSRYVAALHSVGIFLLDADGSNERALTTDPRLNPGAQVDPYLDAFLLGWCQPGPWLDDAWGPYAEPTPP